MFLVVLLDIVSIYILVRKMNVYIDKLNIIFIILIDICIIIFCLKYECYL